MPEEFSKGGPIAVEVAKILRKFRKQWFPPRTSMKWGPWKRFFYSATGSAAFTLAAAMLIPERLAQGYVGAPEGASQVDINLRLFLDLPELTLTILLVAIIFFGYLGSWTRPDGKHRNSPIRFYFSGFLIPAFSFAIASIAISN